MSFDAVDFMQRVARGCQDHGVRIVYYEGWEWRGNGSQWAAGGPKGHVNHHTAGGNNIYIDENLVWGVPGLSGPLCNTCLMYDGDLGIIAAYPANHAGASGGWDTAPLPYTSYFNNEVWGTEIQYKGTEPMSDAQYRTMCILNNVLTRERGWPSDFITCKNHDGTSIEGKWDPGWAEGQTYDINKQRRDFGAIGESDWTVGYQEEILAQETGSPELGQFPGWPTRRHNVREGENPAFSQTDYAREIDRELNSLVEVDKARPRPLTEKDSLLGHVLSLRAEINVLLDALERLGDDDEDASGGGRPRLFRKG